MLCVVQILASTPPRSVVIPGACVCVCVCVCLSNCVCVCLSNCVCDLDTSQMRWSRPESDCCDTGHAGVEYREIVQK
jgi:hypothetical protein